MTVGQHTGAVWRSTDLQCHTPRDRGWCGSPHLPGGTAEENAARDAWAAEFVAAAVAKQLSLVAVTDHHDYAMLPHVQRAAATSGLVILPGMEITCEDGVQVLALFEAESGADLWTRLVSKLKSVGPIDVNSSRGAQVADCGCTVADLFEEVANDDTLRRTVLLIPHFGNEDAHKSLNQKSRAGRARDLPCEGVYIECPIEHLVPATLDKIQGRLVEWGNRRRAVVATGDNRKAHWGRLGAHPCWIKLGETSLEGLRQAFLADEPRLTHSVPQHPSESVLSVEVLSTLTGDNPVKVTFNSGFNAFIGGRGSGKSAFLEYLRFGLGRSDGDFAGPDSRARKPRDRETELIVDTLSVGWVAVSIEQQGVTQVWTRRGADPETIEVEVSGGKEVLTVDAAQRRFPARAFHQKELSTTMLDPSSAADNITGIAAAEAIEERRRIDGEMVDAKRALNGAAIKAAEHWRAELVYEQARSQVEDLERRLSAVRDQLAQGGVTADDLAVLADSSRFDRARNHLDEVDRKVGRDRARVQELVPSLLRMDGERHADIMSFEALSRLDELLAITRGKMQEAAHLMLALLDRTDAEAKAARAAFEVQASHFSAAYASARDRQAAHQSLIAEGESLSRQLATVAAAQTAAAESEASTRPAQQTLQVARFRLNELVAERRNVLQESVDRIGERSAGMLSAAVKQDRKPAEMVTSLCALFAKSYVRDPETQCEEWVSALNKTDADPDWPGMCDRLLAVYRAKIRTGGSDNPGAEATAELGRLLFNGAGAFTGQQLPRVYGNLNDQSVGAILGATPRDTISLTYVKNGKQIPFQKASSGEQASALLRLLLRQSAGTLIVDQPEDDLDNRVVMDIVREIRTSKNNRQLIFATHNSNLVVNGDADKVLVMRATVPDFQINNDVPRVQVEVDGAIETASVRQAVTVIMEGGADAFELRSRKYAAPAGPLS